MSGSELLVAMRKDCPRAQLRDISRLLRQFEARRLIYCLTPKAITGRLYFFTERGRRTARTVLSNRTTPLPSGVNWNKYAEVIRGSTRKLVLLEMETPWKGKAVAKTATMIRKQLLAKHPLGLGATIRAIQELEQLKVIRRCGVTQKRRRPLYQLTQKWSPKFGPEVKLDFRGFAQCEIEQSNERKTQTLQRGL